jgi:hypothetical protein
MELFAITNDEVSAAFKAKTEKQFGKSGGAVMWINGKQSSNGDWFVYNPTKMRLNSNDEPSSTYSGSNSCLDWYNANSSFITGITKPCGATISFYCEYKK